jgi:hypothetical protein
MLLGAYVEVWADERYQHDWLLGAYLGIISALKLEI